MRKYIFIVFLLIFCFLSYDVFTNKGGPTDGVAGNPPLNETCAAASCHTGSALNSGGGTATIVCKDSLSTTVTSYIPNNTYTVTVSISEGTKTRYGFEAVVMKGIGANATRLGTLSIADTAKTQLFNGFVLHKQAGIDFSGTTGSWSFLWKAPAANLGIATIYAAFNASNKDGENTGDKIYTKTLALTGTGPLVGIASDSQKNKINFYPNPASSHINFNFEYLADITIYNLSGMEIKKLTHANSSSAVDINDLSPGIYFVNIISEKNRETFKFIKQ